MWKVSLLFLFGLFVCIDLVYASCFPHYKSAPEICIKTSNIEYIGSDKNKKYYFDIYVQEVKIPNKTTIPKEKIDFEVKFITKKSVIRVKSDKKNIISDNWFLVKKMCRDNVANLPFPDFLLKFFGQYKFNPEYEIISFASSNSLDCLD